MKRRMSSVILLAILLAGCAGAEAAPPQTAPATTALAETQPPETTVESTEEATTATTLAPFYFDEYSVRYVLTEGNDYAVDPEYREEVETPESSAFTRISYHPGTQALAVTFRSSGASYVYQEVPPEVWVAFKAADSRGQFYNREIKGIYQGRKQ